MDQKMRVRAHQPIRSQTNNNNNNNTTMEFSHFCIATLGSNYNAAPRINTPLALTAAVDGRFCTCMEKKNK